MRLQSIFEERLGSRWLHIHEVAILAAVFESFASTEETARPEHAYMVEGIFDPSALVLDLDGRMMCLTHT